MISGLVKDAKAIRNILKRAYPCTIFRVRSKVYAAGYKISVSYKGYLNEKAVEKTITDSGHIDNEHLSIN